MEFYLVGIVFWGLTIISIFLFLLGLWNKSWKVLLTSGVFLILPSLYFYGAENWFKLFIITPFIPFLMAYYYKSLLNRS